MKKTHTRGFWVGFTDGVPDISVHTDTYGEQRGMQLFTERKDARKRYADIRFCEVQIKEKV